MIFEYMIKKHSTKQNDAYTSSLIDCCHHHTYLLNQICQINLRHLRATFDRISDAGPVIPTQPNHDTGGTATLGRVRR